MTFSVNQVRQLYVVTTNGGIKSPNVVTTDKMQGEMIVHVFKSNKECYYQLSFEQEAYDKQYNLDYLKNRRHYVWLKYINILIK